MILFFLYCVRRRCNGIVLCYFFPIILFVLYCVRRYFSFVFFPPSFLLFVLYRVRRRCNGIFLYYFFSLILFVLYCVRRREARPTKSIYSCISLSLYLCLSVCLSIYLYRIYQAATQRRAARQTVVRGTSNTPTIPCEFYMRMARSPYTHTHKHTQTHTNTHTHTHTWDLKYADDSFYMRMARSPCPPFSLSPPPPLSPLSRCRP
jgi:hypothetical protein